MTRPEEHRWIAFPETSEKSADPEIDSALGGFLAGPENRLAETLFSWVLDETPSADLFHLSPILLYGPTGVGKTRLADGMRHVYQQHDQRADLVALTGQEFFRRWTAAYGSDSLPEFRDRLERSPLAVFESVDFLGRRQNGLSALQTILDRRRENGVPTLLTATERPERTAGFSDALCARLTEGLIVPLVYPAAGSRRLILEKFAAAFRIKLNAETLTLLVERLPDSVRGMYGVFYQMRALFDSSARRPSIKAIRAFLEERSPQKTVTLEEIARASAKHFSVKVTQLCSKSRSKTVVLARNMAIYLTRTQTDSTLADLGAWFGRDHTTVLHGFREIEKRLADDLELAAARDAILRELS